MLDALTHNPYRILGGFSNTPKDVLSQNIENIFSEISGGNVLSFVTDIAAILGPLERTPNTLKRAEDLLRSDASRVRYALFWFFKGGAIDEVALAHLEEGNSDRAREVFEKKQNVATHINLATLSLIQGDYLNAIGTVAKVIQKEDLREEFLSGVLGKGKAFTKEELSLFFLQGLAQEEKITRLFDVGDFLTPEKASLFLENILCVRERLAIAIKNVGPARSMPVIALKSAERLIETTKEPLLRLKETLGKDNALYQHLSNKISFEAMSMVVAYIDFMQNCPPGHATLYAEAKKARSFFLALEAADMKEETRRQLQENKKVLDTLIADESDAPKKKEGCYIATMVYGDYNAPEVIRLRRFRDNTLKPHFLGRVFIHFYYAVSPSICSLLREKTAVHAQIRRLLDAFIAFGRF